jgi:hypothetical protein
LASMAHLKIQFFHFSLAGVRQRGDTIVLGRDVRYSLLSDTKQYNIGWILQTYTLLCYI